MYQVLEQIQKIGIVPVVVLDDAKDAMPLAQALCNGGIACAEVTFRTAAAQESIRIMTEAFPNMLVGAGTVLTIEQVDRAVEAGAKCCLFQPDEVNFQYFSMNQENGSWIYADEDANYCQVINYNAEAFVPLCACPSKVDNIKPVAELEGTPIDQVFIGSCTNGRLEDLAIAAKILKGKTIKCKLIITPASRDIYLEAIKVGYIDILSEAGAMITHPSCGLCCGRAGGIRADGEVVRATHNQNFRGKIGRASGRERV